MRIRLQAVSIAVLAAGCAATTLPTEAPLPVNPLQFARGEVRVPEQVLVITDASGTMYESQTFPEAKALTRTFIAVMPDSTDSGYEAGLVGFGGDERIAAPLAPFDRGSLARTASGLRILGEIHGRGGRTPYHAVLNESRAALVGKSGAAAVVIFSDGLPDDDDLGMLAARSLVASRNGRVCIHTVQTGDDSAGTAYLERLSRFTGCGSSRSAASIENGSAFTQFARDVFTGAGPAPDICGGVIRLRGVEFEFDSDGLAGASAVVLDAALESLRDCPNIEVRVEGHTDSIGTDAYNQELGLRRANAVRRYMIDGGMGAGRLSARSFGESRPIASNDTEEGRALNRRVELHTD
ncbi:MAG: OmpA family protein [Myxococcota bacterium]